MDVPTQIQHAADAAAKADIALVFTGRTNEFKPEGYDRETMDLTADQYKLISAVSAQNRNTVIVNYSGSPVNMVTFVDDVAAILQCSFPGQEAGHSMLESWLGKQTRADVNACFGNWPTDDNDVIRYEKGIFGGYKHYDLPGAKAPLSPFGFGSQWRKNPIINAY